MVLKMLRSVLTVGLISMGAVAQTAPDSFVRTHYTKMEFHIPMRDGVKLYASAYVPKPDTFDDHGPYPLMITRTPYACAPYGADKFPRRVGPSPELEKSGYIFVCEDVRGRYQSEGVFVESRPQIDDKKSAKDVDESSDMYDTVEFLLKHLPNNNGKVGVTGTSYPGFYTSAAIINSHPAIKAASPQAPMTDLFDGEDDAYHNGAFMLAANYGFYPFFLPQKTPVLPGKEKFDAMAPDAYNFYLHGGNLAALNAKLTDGGKKESYFTDQMTHDTYDEYWKSRNLAPHMKGVHAAVMTVGGWFDAEDLTGPLKTYRAIEKFNPGITNTIVIGPWVHGGWHRAEGDHLGDVQFGSNTSEFFRKEIEFPFFEKYLKGKRTEDLPEAYVFETGKNEWRKYAQWPPKNAVKKTLYFGTKGTLSWTKPQMTDARSQYVSDPAHPVPFTSYVTNTVPQRYMVDDQRFAATRPDVLVFETEPLKEDVTIAGPVVPKLFVASTGTDSDFVVKLIDVYPENEVKRPEKRVSDAPPVMLGGYQQLLRGEPFRAKFRNSLEKPEPLVPGEVTPITFTMNDLHHTFLKGHRIMVQVQSSWFPLADLNPQTFTTIWNAKPEQFVKATETVFHNVNAPSGVELTVLPR